MALFLAIGAGGTKTRCLLADETEILGRAATGSVKLVRVSEAEASSRLRAMLSEVSQAANVSLCELSQTDLDLLYSVNVRGTYLCIAAAMRTMLPAGCGVIVNLASIAATAGLSNRFAYSMTIGAVLSMTLSVAKDYLSHGIRCNCISPARVHTPFVDGFVAKNIRDTKQSR